MAISPEQISDLTEITTALATYVFHVNTMGGTPLDRRITLANLLKDTLTISGGEVDFKNADLVNVNDIVFNGSINLIHYCKALDLELDTFIASSSSVDESLENVLFDYVDGEFTFNNTVIIRTPTADENMLKFSKPGWYKIIINTKSDVTMSSSFSNDIDVVPELKMQVYDYDSGGDIVTLIDRYSINETSAIQHGNIEKFRASAGGTSPHLLWGQQEVSVYIENELRDRLKLTTTNTLTGTAVTGTPTWDWDTTTHVNIQGTE